MNKLIFATMLLSACGAAEATDTEKVESAAELANTPAKADDAVTWCHANLYSNDGTQMVFDYQVKNSGTLVEGEYEETGDQASGADVWLNVRNDNFKSTDSALAVVLVESYPYVCDDCGSVTNNVYQQQMTYAGGRFTTSLPDLNILNIPAHSDGSDINANFWEVAVNVNGTWYKDPNTGNNLRYWVAKVANECPQGYTF
jgi:hypothetical protein